MNLEKQEAYNTEQIRLRKMSIAKLQAWVGVLFRRRYEEYDIRVEAQYRLASLVLNQRTRQGTSLIYHLE
jgi:hypothetical protein